MSAVSARYRFEEWAKDSIPVVTGYAVLLDDNEVKKDVQYVMKSLLRKALSWNNDKASSRVDIWTLCCH
jgi:hypothetical protein